MTDDAALRDVSVDESTGVATLAINAGEHGGFVRTVAAFGYGFAESSTLCLLRLTLGDEMVRDWMLRQDCDAGFARRNSHAVAGLLNSLSDADADTDQEDAGDQDAGDQDEELREASDTDVTQAIQEVVQNDEEPDVDVPAYPEVAQGDD